MTFNMNKGREKKLLTSVGDRYENKVGQWCTVIRYEDSKTVTVVFDECPDIECNYTAGDLRRGCFKNKSDPMNMLGKKFKNNSGEWVTVVEYKRAIDVVVKFEDGAIMKTATSYLKTGTFTHPDKFTSLIGKRFKNKQGDWCTIIEYRGATDILVEFDGYLDNHKSVALAALQKGCFKNNYKPVIYGVGYLGDGNYQGTKGNRLDIVYGIWNNMLARNYDAYTQTKQPAYIGGSVCEEWLNFNNFCDWYVNHESYGLGYNLDKDLLVKGNRLYSPETCTMLPIEINSMIAGSPKSKNGLPLGVNKIDNGYVARLNKHSEGREYLGYYKTPEEAHEVYVTAKERYVHNTAIKWANRLEWKAFKALMNWEVYPKEAI